MIYKIKHYEESVGYFEVEADDEDGALNKYYQIYLLPVSDRPGLQFGAGHADPAE